MYFPLETSDIWVHDDHLEINIRSSKTDQFRQVIIVFIAKSYKCYKSSPIIVPIFFCS